MYLSEFFNHTNAFSTVSNIVSLYLAALSQQNNNSCCIFAAAMLYYEQGDNMIALGEYLRDIRLQKNYSLKDVYRATGISDSTLSRIENAAAASEPSPSILKALSKLYGINLIELYRMAGYLDEEALSSYVRVFQNVDLLTKDERNHIQTQVDWFTKGRK